MESTSSNFKLSTTTTKLHHNNNNNKTMIIIHNNKSQDLIQEKLKKFRPKPVWMRLDGRDTRRKAAMLNTKVPIDSSRNPIHSFAALLWKSILRFSSTRSKFTWANRSWWPKHRMVMDPAIVSEKCWMTGALVRASTRVNSLDVVR